MTPDEFAQTLGIIRNRAGSAPIDTLVTLGSGLGSVADDLGTAIDIDVADLPGMPVSQVPGHRGVLRVVDTGGHRILVQQGRVHLYEGHAAADVTRTIDVAAALGAATFVVTNAAGGIDTTFEPGDVMAITDHLNLTGTSPHLGVLIDGSPIFQDMAEAYAPALRHLLDEVAEEQGVGLRSGVYAGLLGPAYETAAEVAMLRTLGADAVGMSTVLEVINARNHGMQVLGVSTITNVHGPGVATSHDEVVAVGAQVRDVLANLLVAFLRRLSTAD